jgi:hypothetical protein
LPLTLEQDAAYLQATGTTPARYLPLLRARQAGLLARGQAAGHPANAPTRPCAQEGQTECHMA